MGSKICLIDDDSLFRETLAHELRSLGHDVAEAGDARRGVELIRNNAFDAVVVDVLMPDVDGLELIVEVRAEWPTTRVIAISGGGRLSADLCIDLAQSSGADSGLKKPFSARDILARICSDISPGALQT